MKAQRVVCPEPGRVEFEEVTLDPPKAGEILVETELTLISPGTERAWFTREAGAPVRFPYRPGYCHVGRVVAVGEGVTRFRPGDRVLSHSSHASAVIAREDRAYRVPEGVPARSAVFTVLGAIALQGVRKARIELGASVGVLGAGLIGLFATRFAQLSGAYPLVVADLSASRRERALRYGAHKALDLGAFLEEARTHEQRAKPDAGFDAVIDATGHPAAFGTAIKACGFGATLVLLGSTRGLAEQVDVYAIHQKGIQVVGAHNRVRPPSQSYPGMWTSRDDCELILRLLRDGVISVDELVTDEISPDQVPDAFARLVRRDETMLGTVIKWA